jgi:hypothetical protein
MMLRRLRRQENLMIQFREASGYFCGTAGLKELSTSEFLIGTEISLSTTL